MVVSLYLLFEVLAVVVCLHYLYGEKFRFDIVTVSIISIDLIWMQAIYYFHWNQSWSLMIYPIIIVYCILRFGFDVKAIVVNNILYLLIVCSLQLFLAVIISAISGIVTVDVEESLIINIITFVIILLGMRKLHILSKFLQNRERLIVITFCVDIGGMLFAMVKYRGEKGIEVWIYIFLFTSIILVCLIAARLGKYKLGMLEAETELRTYKLYEDSFRSLIDEIRARQHEFDNHINVIYGDHYLYHTHEELVQAQKDYCRDIIAENRYNKLLAAGNSMIIGFLYGKFIEAEKYGIHISYKTVMQDLECGVPIYKLVELLGNLINNAIEELRVSAEKKQLMVRIIELDKKVEIEVGNEVDTIDYNKIQKFFEKGYSSKGTGRGYGLYNVKRICESYQMEIECRNERIEGKNLLIFKITKEKKPLEK